MYGTFARMLKPLVRSRCVAVAVTSYLASPLISLPVMGSVGRTHRCPWCGRTGNGGYAMDGVDTRPICTGGRYSCLWHQVQTRGYDLTAFRVEQLRAITRDRVPAITGMTQRTVAEFLS